MTESSPEDLTEWADRYDESHDRYIEVMTEISTNVLSGPILDVGAAPYELTRRLQNRGYGVTALDLDPDRLRERIQEWNLDVRECDIENEEFPFNDNSFQGVLLTEVIEHLRIDPLQTLREIRRVLHPDGALVVSAPNAFSIYNIHNLLMTGMLNDPYEEYRKLERFGHMGHVREYTPAEIRSLLSESGLRVLESRFETSHQLIDANSGIHAAGLITCRLIPMFRELQIHIASPQSEKIDRTEKGA